MFHIVHNILNQNDLAALRAAASATDFAGGAVTAGVQARKVKHNLQATGFVGTAAHNLVLQKLARSREFQAAALPARLSNFILSKYEVGMAYGRHVDNVWMEGGRVRSDVAMTLFLSDPESYEGGELCISVGGSGLSEVCYKLPAGSMILYPAHYVHYVSEVTAGTRLALIGWIQSTIKDADQRQIIYEIGRAQAAVSTQSKTDDAAQGLNRAIGSLMRMWVDR